MSRHDRIWSVATILFASLLSPAVQADVTPSTVEPVAEGVLQVRDESGNWGGSTMGITHQRGPHYWAKKVLDLSGMPDDAWKRVEEIRLSAFFCVRDYSWHDCPPANGLDEAIELVVNGQAHRVPTRDGLPVYREGKSMASLMRWHDFVVPKEEINRGRNEIIFRMAPVEDKPPDDYLYLGIDNTAPGGNSFVRFGADSPWREDALTIPGGRGEYMVRLYLLSGPRAVEARWLPADGRLDDPRGVICYAGSHGPTTRVEWDPRRIDPLEAVSVRVETDGPQTFSFAWLDGEGTAVSPAEVEGPAYTAALEPPWEFVPSGIELPKSLGLRSVRVNASAGYHPEPPRVDVAPRMKPPAGGPAARSPFCRIEAERITLANDNLRCEFTRHEGRLQLASLYNEITASEMVRRPEDVALWLVEVAGKRYAGSRDFVCRSLGALEDGRGFRAECVCEAVGLEAVFKATIDDDLRLGLTVKNGSAGPLDFKAAFPHFAGLAVSDDPSDDYYFFPRSLLVSNAPALIRQGYGDHQALYQWMGLFSPSRGGGLALRSTDDDGRYKVLALRKHVPGRAETNEDTALTPTAEEFKWTNSLPAVPGVGLACEYLRRTREPGGAFTVKDVALEAHPGDWHTAMHDYARWCRQVWRFRPYPSRLTPLLNMIAAGWGQSPLARDGKYRTDVLGPRCDCIELMSWWEWSTLGPKGIPLDQVSEKLGEAKYERWKSYFVPDPATGQRMFSNNPGDYDGYNQRWGGLPALREAIEMYRNRGALVTLYTDPFRVDYGSKCGRQYGERWGVVQPDGSYRDDYDAWRMCHDVAEYRQWVADTMRRVLRETGADGIRLDEYGHAGSACFSDRHQHTFAERGCTEWQRGVAEATRLVRRAMDEVDPRSVLTTEHPGYDFLMPPIEGCITYDLTVLASPLRPVEVNLQRFYFPECKAFELDHRGADPKHHKRFWNAVGSFGSYYPVQYDAVLRENADAFSSLDCQPLVPTLARCVYANRFRCEGKEIYTLYNGTGHTFYGDVLGKELPPDQHVVDLLRREEAEVDQQGGPALVRMFLPREEVACLAVLPRRISVARDGDRLNVEVSGRVEDCRVNLCDASGKVLASAPVEDDRAAIVLDRPAGEPACVKLCRNNLLLDVAALPGRHGPIKP
ncbi:MAG TPA: DUF6259 domain-containing protein [Thermoguttaceae bacterium]|nr:DUF6259 domain-containing protein [Thermoguttaceae bacterium]